MKIIENLLKVKNPTQRNRPSDLEKVRGALEKGFRGQIEIGRGKPPILTANRPVLQYLGAQIDQGVIVKPENLPDGVKSHIITTYPTVFLGVTVIRESTLYTDRNQFTHKLSVNFGDENTIPQNFTPEIFDTDPRDLLSDTQPVRPPKRPTPVGIRRRSFTPPPTRKK